MAHPLNQALRAAAKGSGWSVKQNMLSKRCGDHVLAVHPRPGMSQVLEFRAKPMVWDQTLWSILQIKGNEKKPVSFYFWAAFNCDCPAVVQRDLPKRATPEETAASLLALAHHAETQQAQWQGYDLSKAIESETPHELYRYQMTRVVERICQGDWQAADEICVAARNKELDVRHTYYGLDELTSPDENGRWVSQPFFEMAQIWMERSRAQPSSTPRHPDYTARHRPSFLARLLRPRG